MPRSAARYAAWAMPWACNAGPVTTERVGTSLQPGQVLVLQFTHGLTRGFGLVTMTEQVQKAVHHHPMEFLLGGEAQGGGVVLYAVIADQDIPAHNNTILSI